MRPLLLFALAFMSLIHFRANANDSCTKTNSCFTFKSLGATRFDTKRIKLTFTAKMSCLNRLDYIAFELPEGSQAAPPSNTMQNTGYVIKNGRYSSTGQNQINTPFNAIQYNAKNTALINTGIEDTFEFYLLNEDYDKLAATGMRVQARTANGTTGLVSFNLNVCAPVQSPDQAPATSCGVNSTEANFGFLDAITLSDGNSIVRFLITNHTAWDVSSVTIETPKTPKPIGVFSDNSGTNYKAKYNYTTSIDQNTDIITFSAQNTRGYANGDKDIFAILVPTDVYQLSPVFTLTAKTSKSSVTRSFNTRTCTENVIVPLPVELESFEGKATQSGIALTWTTASEKNSASFEIQRSQDGKNFETVESVGSRGNSSTKQVYKHLDGRAKAGVNYYRLKQNDLDNTFEYSKIIAVDWQRVKTTDNLSVYPNPARGQLLTVMFDNYNNESTDLRIVDRNGQELYSSSITKGANRADLPMAELKLPAGLYFVKIKNSSQAATRKLIVP